MPTEKSLSPILPVEASARSARRALILAFVVWIASSGALIIDRVVSRSEIFQLGQELQQATAVVEQLLLQDEKLSHAAQLMAATGDPFWSRDYAAASNNMESLLSRVASIAPQRLGERVNRARKLKQEFMKIEAGALDRHPGERTPLFRDAHYTSKKDGFTSIIRGIRSEVLNLYGRALDELKERSRSHMIAVLALALASCLVASWKVLESLRAARAAVRASQEELRWQANHDDLTGLANRRFFVEQKCAARKLLQPDENLAVLLFDLDGFKQINDRYGHLVGDEVLKEVSARLGATAASGRLVARLGGDEFGVLFKFTGDEHVASFAARVQREVSAPIYLANLCLNVGATAGYSVWSGEKGVATPFGELDGSESQTILRHADMALKAAKSRGRGCCQRFEPRMDQELLARAELEAEIKPAIAAGQIIPFYQPIVDMRRERVIGFEMLARWLHPAKGMIPPSEFIPAAESTGTIGAMTRNLVRQAMEDAAGWPSDTFLSINLSPTQFKDPWLITGILSLIRADFPLRRLQFEITENALIEDIESARQIIDSLRRMGVRVALDDFGAGYAGIRYLSDFKFDMLKVDRSLVSRVAATPKDGLVIKAVLRLARAMKMDVIVEGVESSEVRSKLLEIGCTLAQGYHFGRPRPAHELEQNHPQDEERLLA